MVQIGGFHIRPPKTLPGDLQKFLDDAKEGVIYFSLGSNLRSKNLPPQKRDAFLTAFSKLKQRVLWKWEDEDLPGKPPNVKIAKWFPQQDILAHPNVKLFITHCGLLSTTETVFHGVPILAIPVFADQHRNAEIATHSGYALSLPYEDPSFSEVKLSGMLQELLTNPQYTDNIKKRSQLFHDRPLKPMDSAVYWVEYVIRTKGAHHLGVAAVKIPWYIYHSLDVISFITIIFSLSIYVLFISIRKIVICCKSQKPKEKIKLN
uniref:UDP-glucuronosyltransferase n=2 Tax=Anoplophora glabripennis TaxID=217634 RepID=V5GK87_ANOGL